MNKNHYKKVIAGAIGVLVIGTVFVRFGFANGASDMEKDMAATSEATSTAPVIATEIAKVSPADALGLNTVSWSGEILSTSNLAIHPPREGSITQWHVRIGDSVRKGQVIATLSLPPASTERIMLLAEKQGMIVKSKANVESTSRFIESSRKNLETYKIALEKSRDAAVAAAEKNASVALDATNLPTSSSDVRAAQGGTINSMQTALRAMIQQMVEQHVRSITRNVNNPELPQSFSYLPSVGAYSGQALNDFDPIMLTLLQKIREGQPIKEELATKYFAALQRLILTISPTEEFPASMIADLKAMASRDRIEVLEAYADLNTEIRETRIMVEEAKTGKDKMIAEANAEYAEKQAMLEKEIADLNREIEMANAEVRASEVAYDEITNGLSNLNVVAPRDGFISGIYEDIGHFVEPNMLVASMNTSKKQDLYIRFRIPSNASLPTTGDIVVVSRPGFALQEAKAKILGVGDALDPSGSYLADATFIDPPTWPINASVRIHPESEHAGEIAVTIPFSALVREGETQMVWTVRPGGILEKTAVKTRRTIGDTVEVIDGLGEGMRFIPNPTPDLKEGMSLSDAAPVEKPKQEEKPKKPMSHEVHGE